MDWLTTRLREERGLTLAELLTAQLVAGVVLAAAAILVISSMRGEQRVSDKVNSVSQGRTVAAQLEQRLNSQVCLFTGEYSIGSTVATAAAKSILHASPNTMIYFADISERSSGATNGVGFQPSIRYLQAPTAGTGRHGGFVDSFRSASNNSIPFNFNLGGATLASLGAIGGPVAVPPTSVLHRVGDGVTNAVDAGSGAPVPFLQYWTSDQLGPTGVPVTMTGGVVPASEIDRIGRIRVNYRILAASGRDSGLRSGPGAVENRTESFSSDIYLRTSPDICDQLGT